MEINKETRRSTRTKKAVQRYEAPVHVPYTHMNRLADKFGKLKLNNTPGSSPVAVKNAIAALKAPEAPEAPIANMEPALVPINVMMIPGVSLTRFPPRTKTFKRRRSPTKSRSRGSRSRGSRSRGSRSRSVSRKSNKNNKSNKNHSNKKHTKRKLPFFKKNNSKNKNTTHKQKRQRVNWKNLMTAFNTKTKLNNSKNKSKSKSKSKNHSKNLKGGSLPSGGYDETTEFGPHMLDTDSGDAVVIGKVGDVFTPMSREVYEKEYKGEGFNIQEA